MIDRLSRRRGEEGFTLIELLVVIVILGVLSAVVVFAVRGTGDKGRQAAYDTDARTIRTAQEAFCAKFGKYATQQQLVDEKFLSEPPEYHRTGPAPDGTVNAEGNCKGSGELSTSKFFIQCNTSEAGCGEDATLALGGTLVIHQSTANLNPALNPAVTSEGSTHSNSEDMFNGLLRYEPNGAIGGDLAQTFKFEAVPAASNPNCTAVGNPGGATPVTCDPTTTKATFVLREGVKFHGKVGTTIPGDGATLTPADVEFSFSKAILAAHGRSRAMNVPLGVTGSGLSTSVPEQAIVTAPPTPGNGGTVTFYFRQVFAPLKYSLNVTEAPIISEAAYGPCWDAGTLFTLGNACPANEEPVGTGPFRFKSFSASSGIRTEKNVDYFRKDASGRRLPYLDEVFKAVLPGTGATLLQGGTVDVASIANQDRPLFAGDSRFVLSQTPRGSGGGNCITTIAFNTTKRAIVGTDTNAAGTVANPPPGGSTAIGQPPESGGYPATSPYYGQNKAGSNVNAEPHRILGDSRVREAIFKSLDRNKFWTDIAYNAGRVADAPVHSIFQPDGAYQGPQPLPSFDRTAAGALLDAAGWDGPRVEADSGSGFAGFRTALNHPQVPNDTKLALEYLASTGNETFASEVKSQLKLVGIDVTPVHGANASIVAPRIFHARTFDMAQISYCNNDEPQFGVRRQYHTDQLVQTNAFTNASGYKSVMMDQLWLDASKAPDVATYQSKFLQIQRLALGLSTTGGVTVTPGSVEDKQRIPMVQMLESAGTRGTRALCTGFNNNNTGLYMEAVSCRR